MRAGHFAVCIAFAGVAWGSRMPHGASTYQESWKGGGDDTYRGSWKREMLCDRGRHPSFVERRATRRRSDSEAEPMMIRGIEILGSKIASARSKRRGKHGKHKTGGGEVTVS